MVVMKKLKKRLAPPQGSCRRVWQRGENGIRRGGREELMLTAQQKSAATTKGREEHGKRAKVKGTSGRGGSSSRRISVSAF